MKGGVWVGGYVKEKDREGKQIRDMERWMSFSPI